MMFSKSSTTKFSPPWLESVRHRAEFHKIFWMGDLTSVRSIFVLRPPPSDDSDASLHEIWQQEPDCLPWLPEETLWNRNGCTNLLLLDLTVLTVIWVIWRICVAGFIDRRLKYSLLLVSQIWKFTHNCKLDNFYFLLSDKKHHYLVIIWLVSGSCFPSCSEYLIILKETTRDCE